MTTGTARTTSPRTVAQAAEDLNISKSTVRAWIAQRRLGHVRLRSGGQGPDGRDRAAPRNGIHTANARAPVRSVFVSGFFRKILIAAPRGEP